jgi:hypothetical protein
MLDMPASIQGSDDSASMPELLSDSSIASSSGPDDEPQPPSDRQPHLIAIDVSMYNVPYDRVDVHNRYVSVDESVDEFTYNAD